MSTSPTPSRRALNRRAFLGVAAGTPAVAVAGSAGLAQATDSNASNSPDSSKPAQSSFDFDTGNAILEVVFPVGGPPLRESVSRTGMDATTVLDMTNAFDVSSFDAVAPYHPTAVGIYSDLGRRPESEATTRNRNIAILYSAYTVLSDRMPQHRNTWRDMLINVGLDPDDTRENTETPSGIGILAAKGYIEGRRNDGLNRKGDEGGRKYNQYPYADTTGYVPVNTAYELRDPSKWQPGIVTTGNGIFTVQQYVTPQTALTKTYAIDDPEEFDCPPPINSDHQNNPEGYKAQVDEVLAASANLTDEQKMMAELFNDKLASIGIAGATSVWQATNMEVGDLAQYLATVEIAIWDTIIVAWHYKTKYNTVRPFSAVSHVYGDEEITAWGGPGKGTVDDITGNEWHSYLALTDHPEYPSGSSSIITAYAEAAKLFLGSDEIPIEVPAPKGSSLVEPGITPAEDLTLRFNTWTEFSDAARQSRVWSGVHFPASTQEGAEFGKEVARRAYEFVQRHINGTVA